ncbi:hypothetical protein [Xylophilus sp. GOD-11R]|uniref:hypothetical protein n=1 Tax=Xylophilus sp. GOD-11R TaxID=3089814 RepID=UPI00298BDB7F|nr:hypothetical protein [Xylophilus sp. GOD-11R]WPB59144.1 hypothetical protein R9X41_11065 [Xylophilus sp. GOD-11R]
MMAMGFGAGLGPAPFVYAPTDGRVEGPAFSRFFQTLATLLVGGCIGWVIRLWQRDAITYGPGLVWVAAGLALMVWTWVCVLRSRTTVGEQALEQRWIWHKRLPLADLAYCKVLRVPGLDWLVAPRLYARTLSGKFLVFYGATPALRSEFSRLARELSEFRRL